jgi:hypothetical protein
VPSAGCGCIDHVALEGQDYDRFGERLRSLGIAHWCNDVPAAGLKQIFITDPDGICLELNFRTAEGT